MSKIVVLNSEALAQLNPVHSGFAHGFGIFETIKLSAGGLRFWEAHCERFFQSVRAFDMPFTQDDEALLAAIRELVSEGGFQDGLIKMSLLSAADDTCCYVYARSAVRPAGKVKLYLSEDAPLNEHSLLAGHKTHNYMEAMHLLKTVRSSGFTDCIRLNTAGVLAETTVANLFFICEETLHTPALSTGILPGVVRAEVLEAAKALSIRVEAGAYPIERLKTCRAAFLTNASMGLQAVDAIEGKQFNLALEASHPMIDELKAALAEAEARKSVTLI